MTDPLLSVTSPTSVEEYGITVEPLSGPFLGEQRIEDKGKKTLVLDLDETHVHSTFQEVEDCTYVIPVEIEETLYNVYVYLRPGALEFIQRMSKFYEIVVYTASLRIVNDRDFFYF